MGVRIRAKYNVNSTIPMHNKDGLYTSSLHSTFSKGLSFKRVIAIPASGLKHKQEPIPFRISKGHIPAYGSAAVCQTYYF